jgi:hypothetical protein
MTMAGDGNTLDGLDGHTDFGYVSNALFSLGGDTNLKWMQWEGPTWMPYFRHVGAFHALSHIGTRIFIHGGFGRSDYTLDGFGAESDLLAWESTTSTWSTMGVESNTWKEALHPWPKARYAHAMASGRRTSVGRDRLYIFGGFGLTTGE